MANGSNIVPLAAPARPAPPARRSTAQQSERLSGSVDWLPWEQWRRIARAFNLDTGEGLRGRPAGTGHRQLQVLQCIVAGLEDAQIAHTLGISIGTMRDYKTELFRKMQVDRRCRAVAKAWRASLGP